MKIDPQQFGQGMALQLEGLKLAQSRGMVRRGWKIGINVPEVQQQLSLPHAGIGWLDGNQVLDSGSVFHAPPDSLLHLEPEVAILISGKVRDGCSPSSVRSQIAAIHPALEIVNYARPTSGLNDLVAHSMFHEATVLGHAVPAIDMPGLGTEWPILTIGSDPPFLPRADLVPEDLGELVAFASAYLSAFGQSLEDGDLLLSGAFLARAPSIAPGIGGTAEFGPMGSVSVRIETREEDREGGDSCSVT